MKVGVWVAVCLLAVNVGLNAYGLVKPEVSLPKPTADQVSAERIAWGELAEARIRGKLLPSDEALFDLLERREAQRRLEKITGAPP